ncbi:MAG TPA: MFS transporter [bacterium]|nr:MFS transporter [bacterium]
MSKPKLPFNKLLGYSSGYIGVSILDRLAVAAVIYYYLPPAEESLPQLVPKIVFGYIFIFGRIIDSIADPLVSYWTDKCKSKRGRRLPFMLYGGVPLALSLVLLFFQPTCGISAWNSVWLAGMLGLYFFFFTYYVCPYLALIPELSKTHKERMNTTSLQGVLMLIGTVIASIAFAPLAAKYGFKAMALMLGGVALIFLYMPVISIDEKKYCDATPSELNLFSSLLMTFKNKPFVIYLIGNLSFWFGFNIISSGVTYYVTVLLGIPKENTAVFMGIVFGVALIFIPVTNMIAKKIGKRKTMIAMLLIFTLVLPLIFFMNAGWLPVSNLVFGYTIMGFCGVPLAGIFIVPNAIVADLTDYDEMKTGNRREAMYFGAQGLCLKITMGISTFLMTLLFSWFGNSMASPLGVQLTGPIGGLFSLIGLIAFLKFPGNLESTVEKFRSEKEAALSQNHARPNIPAAL